MYPTPAEVKEAAESYFKKKYNEIYSGLGLQGWDEYYDEHMRLEVSEYSTF